MSQSCDLSLGEIMRFDSIDDAVVLIGDTIEESVNFGYSEKAMKLFTDFARGKLREVIYPTDFRGEATDVTLQQIFNPSVAFETLESRGMSLEAKSQKPVNSELLSSQFMLAFMLDFTLSTTRRPGVRGLPREVYYHPGKLVGVDGEYSLQETNRGNNLMRQSVAKERSARKDLHYRRELASELPQNVVRSGPSVKTKNIWMPS